MKKIKMADILALPIEERVWLVGDIWDGIGAVPEAVVLSAAEKEELDRRLDAYHRDPQAGAPWDEVKKKLNHVSSTLLASRDQAPFLTDLSIMRIFHSRPSRAVKA